MPARRRENVTSSINPGSLALSSPSGVAELKSTPSVDPGPWWYALTSAAGIAAVTLVNTDTEADNLTTWIGVLALSLGITLFDARRQTINFGSAGKNKFVIVGAIALFILTIAIWSATAETIGYEDFVPGWMIVGWLITSAMLLGLRSLLLQRSTP